MSRAHAHRVVVTGIGAVSTFGVGAEVLWRQLRAGISGIGPLHHTEAKQLRVRVAAQLPPTFDPAAYIPEGTLTMLDRSAQFALIAANEAVSQSGLEFSSKQLSARSGVVIGCGVGGDTTHDEQSRRLYKDNAVRLHPLTIVRIMINASASQISIAHGLRGPAFVVASACASSNHAIAQAMQIIRLGLADVMLSGGTDSCFSFGHLRAWEAMRVLADDTCRPFTANRRGLVLGEGAAVFVLESLTHAQARGARIIGELAGFGMCSDAADIVAPDAGGAGTAMTLALADAGLKAADIDYVNAHGTGTRANDAVETRAIHQVFGPHAQQVAVSSTKSMHGHALGAAGALELVAILGALRDDVVPPTANFDQADPECDLDYVPNTGRALKIRAALSNSFAFGGMNAVLAVTRM